MDLLVGFYASLAAYDQLGAAKPSLNPRRLSPAIQNRPDPHHIRFDAVIDGEGKSVYSDFDDIRRFSRERRRE